MVKDTIDRDPKNVCHHPNVQAKFGQFLGFFRAMEKMGPDGPKRGKMDFFPTDPDPADLLGSTDLDFFHF